MPKRNFLPEISIISNHDIMPEDSNRFAEAIIVCRIHEQHVFRKHQSFNSATIKRKCGKTNALPRVKIPFHWLYHTDVSGLRLVVFFQVESWTESCSMYSNEKKKKKKI